MPRYKYTAKIAPRKTTQGNIDAESEADALQKLAKSGLFLLSIESENLYGEKNTSKGRKISNKDIALFTRQLSSLLESGVNLLSALKIISSQNTNKSLKAALEDITSKIKDGKPLSESLKIYPNIFPNLYSAIIHTGEISGNLSQTLTQLANFMEETQEFKDSISAALSYPIFVFCIAILTCLSLLVFVIPRLVTMFEDMGQALPLATQILINTSSALRIYWWAILAAIITIGFSLQRFYHAPQGRILIDTLKLKIRLFEPLILKTELSRFCRTLSLLLSSGIPIAQALIITETVLNNRILQIEMVKIKNQISQGSSFSTCLKNSKFFPEFVINIIAVGEETGSLDKSLLRIADTYKKDTERFLKSLARILEPLIILIAGLVVGFIVFSMLLPIFQINLIVK